MSNPNSPFSRKVPDKSEYFHPRVDVTPRFLSLGEECLSRGFVTLDMVLFLLGFLLVRLQFSYGSAILLLCSRESRHHQIPKTPQQAQPFLVWEVEDEVGNA